MKKVLKFLVIILIIIAIGIGSFLLYNKFIKNKINQISENSNDSQNNTKVEENDDDGTNPDIAIKSSKDKKIEKEEIEAISIKLFKNADNIEVITNLKNNSDKDIEGFFIEIGLLDKDGNEVTVIAENTDAVIKSNETYKLQNYVTMSLENSKIEDAKINRIEKNTAQIVEDSMEFEKPNE